MRLPPVTTRWMMVVVVIVALLLWPAVTALRVENDVSGRWLYHFWERHSLPVFHSCFNTQHEAPYWPRYWRKLLGQPWPGTYVCDHRGDVETRWGRVVVTVAGAPLSSWREIGSRNPSQLPPTHPFLRANDEYNKWLRAQKAPPAEP